MKPPGQERRRFPRHIGSLPVELREASQSYPIKCETTDISLCGCYVKTMFTLPVGTRVSVRLRLADSELLLDATVRTADPGLGNGIEFSEMPRQQRDLLAHFLEHLLAGSPEAARIIR